MTNDHGWTPLPGVATFTIPEGSTLEARVFGGSISIGRPVDHRTCGCTQGPCTRVATQEDFLCDECREQCR
jgi:hypothetical protein